MITKKRLTDDRCCQIINWVLLIGNNTYESYDELLSYDIEISKDRLGMTDGEFRNQSLIKTLEKTNAELYDFISGKKPKPQWLCQLESYYGLPKN